MCVVVVVVDDVDDDDDDDDDDCRCSVFFLCKYLCSTIFLPAVG